jgi:hypothetical protein
MNAGDPLTITKHVYEVRPRRDKRGFDLISDALPLGRLWYTGRGDAIGYAKHRTRSHNTVIRVYDDSGNVVQTHEHAGGFKEWVSFYLASRRNCCLGL